MKSIKGNIDAQPIRNFNVSEIREDFPILSQKVYGKPLVFLDTGASSQKPQVVIDTVKNCYDTYYANVP